MMNSFYQIETLLLGPMPLSRGFEYKPFLIDQLICVDGGANQLSTLNLNYSNRILLGDKDSLDQHNKDLKYDYILNQNKHFNDFSFALSIIENSFQTHCWGFLGERFDHCLANLGEAAIYQRDKCNQQIIWEDKILSLSKGKHILTHNGPFSFFSAQDGHISITGNIKYQLEKLTSVYAYSSHGLSNVSFGSFQIETDVAVIIVKDHVAFN